MKSKIFFKEPLLITQEEMAMLLGITLTILILKFLSYELFN